MFDFQEIFSAQLEPDSIIKHFYYKKILISALGSLPAEKALCVRPFFEYLQGNESIFKGISPIIFCLDGPDCAGKTTLLEAAQAVMLTAEWLSPVDLALINNNFDVASKNYRLLPLFHVFAHPNRDKRISKTGVQIRKWLNTIDSLSGEGELPSVALQASMTQAWLELQEYILKLSKSSTVTSPFYLIDRGILSMYVFGVLGSVPVSFIKAFLPLYAECPHFILCPSFDVMMARIKVRGDKAATAAEKARPGFLRLSWAVYNHLAEKQIEYMKNYLSFDKNIHNLSFTSTGNYIIELLEKMNKKEECVEATLIRTIRLIAAYATMQLDFPETAPAFYPRNENYFEWTLAFLRTYSFPDNWAPRWFLDLKHKI